MWCTGAAEPRLSVQFPVRDSCKRQSHPNNGKAELAQSQLVNRLNIDLACGHFNADRTDRESEKMNQLPMPMTQKTGDTNSH